MFHLPLQCGLPTLYKWHSNLDRIPVLDRGRLKSQCYLVEPIISVNYLIIYFASAHLWLYFFKYQPAPAGCLQYMSQASGNISSFNWADVSLPGPTYQLANQSYRICFRQEIINSKSVKTKRRISHTFILTTCKYLWMTGEWNLLLDMQSVIESIAVLS